MGRKQNILWIMGVFLLLTTASCATRAATYYVATNGSDSNPGTEAAPFKTIAKGSQKLASGDTLYIRAGTYAESMSNNSNGFAFRNGTAGAYTRFAAYPGEELKAVIKPPGGRDVFISFAGASYVEISGLVFDGTDEATSGSSVIIGRNDLHNRLLKNEFRNARHGIAGGGNTEIIGNVFHHIRNYGIYSGGDNALVEGNTFHDCGGYAIHLHQSPGQTPPENSLVNNWVIRNNTFFNNGSGSLSETGIMRPTEAVIIATGSNTQFYNNLVYNNHGGVTVAAGINNAFIANNTIYGNDTFGLDVSSKWGGSKNAQVVNNIVWGNGSSQLTDTATNTTLQNNLTTDPKFVNASSGDFGLQAGSPAIDKGMTLAQVPTDFTGKKRPEGAAYDIGAFEGAGSKANVLPGMAGGLPIGAGAGAGGTGAGARSGGLSNCAR